jgi:hypothetical protein
VVRRRATRRVLVLNDDMQLRYVPAVSYESFRAQPETRRARLISRVLEWGALGSGLCTLDESVRPECLAPELGH